MARPNQTRQRILDAAARLAADGGVSATTVDQIAEAAGVAKGSVYYNFGAKESIFEQLIEQGVEGITERLREALDEAVDGQADAVTRALVRAFVTRVVERPHVAKVVAAELFRTDRVWRESLDEHRTRIFEVFAEAFVRDGRGRDMLRASAVFGATLMVGFERVAWEPGRTAEECVDAVMG